jgi:cathepsin H
MKGAAFHVTVACLALGGLVGASRPIGLEGSISEAATATRTDVIPNTPDNTHLDFEGYQVAFSKSYKDNAERELRRGIFESNKQRVLHHNAKSDQEWTAEVNKFADLTWDEFKGFYLGAKVNPDDPQECSATGSHVLAKSTVSVPESIDWREKGVVSPVKNQGSCGSCWTFSTTGALEAAHALVFGEIISLAEQQLVDCARNFDTAGCDGGLPSHAFEYIRYNGGLDTEIAYPYHAKDGKCKYNPKAVGTKVARSVNISQGSEAELKDAVGLHKPVSVAFDCEDDFMLYKEGIYSSSKCGNTPSDVNHAVLAVGYGTEGGEHWIVKNSWGTDWGLGGFFKIKRNANMCGIATCASYPELEY